MGLSTTAKRSSKRDLSKMGRRLEKASRLLGQGKVSVLYKDGEFVVFRVVGDTDVHEVVYREGVWMCDCEFNSIYPTHPCSHILACQMYLNGAGGEKNGPDNNI